jgi:hypothetical protein
MKHRAAAAARIVGLIATHPDTQPAGVTVSDAFPRTFGVGREDIHLGDIRPRLLEPANLAGPPPIGQDLHDEFAVDVWVVVSRPGDSGTDARARCGALLEAVVRAIAQHKVLNRGADPHPDLEPVLAAWVSAVDGPSADPVQEGYASMGRVEVHVIARLD